MMSLVQTFGLGRNAAGKIRGFISLLYTVIKTELTTPLGGVVGYHVVCAN
jgi:hypothetical protein